MPPKDWGLNQDSYNLKVDTESKLNRKTKPMEDTTTPQALPGTEQNVPAAVGTGAGSDTVVEVKDLFKQVLNKDFPTNEAAIASLKETFSYVGSMGQKVKTLETQLEEANKNVVTPDLQAQLNALTQTVKDNNFYQAHPEFNTPAIKALITDMGANPEEVIQKDSFKAAAAAIKTTSEMDASQSILHTNPRLGVVQDNMTKASEALKTNNDVEAKDLATHAVLEAYNLK